MGPILFDYSLVNTRTGDVGSHICFYIASDDFFSKFQTFSVWKLT